MYYGRVLEVQKWKVNNRSEGNKAKQKGFNNKRRNEKEKTLSANIDCTQLNSKKKLTKRGINNRKWMKMLHYSIVIIFEKKGRNKEYLR